MTDPAYPTTGHDYQSEADELERLERALEGGPRGAVAVSGIAVALLMFGWLFEPLRHRSRRALLATSFPPHWLPFVERLPFYARLDERGQGRIRDDLRVLVDEKEWEGCGGLVLTDEIRVTIAAISPESRRLTLEASGPRSAAIIEQLRTR